MSGGYRQRMRARAALVGTVLAVLAAGGGPALDPGSAAAGTPNYPVPYSFAADILAAPAGPNTPPPGANDWSCRPTRAHPNPVILVHGLLANETDNWQTYGPLLADDGYCVFSLTYGNDLSTQPPLDNTGGLAPMEQSAKVLAAFVDRVLSATGASKVDIVGHSEGATMPYWYIKFDGGATKVARMVGLAPVVHGTDVAIGPAVIQELLTAFGASPSEIQAVELGCQSCPEFAPQSSFIQELNRGGVAVPGVVYTQIMTRYDELVVPYTNGMVDAPQSNNIVLQDQCAPITSPLRPIRWLLRTSSMPSTRQQLDRCRACRWHRSSHPHRPSARRLIPHGRGVRPVGLRPVPGPGPRRRVPRTGSAEEVPRAYATRAHRR
jgi:triacylglycerol lipase